MKHQILKNGFTLLEMLVVMGVIAIIVGMAAFSYSSAQKKSRDAKRKADLASIAAAMEQYYSICGFTYPTPNQTGAFDNIDCPSPAISIMPTTPADPLTAAAYVCQGTCNAWQYKVCPPVVRTVDGNQYYLEVEDCGPASDNCCIINQQ